MGGRLCSAGLFFGMTHILYRDLGYDKFYFS